MNKDKRIDEMAKDLCRTDTCEIKKIGIPCNHRCKAHIYATRAIEKGYRKASEVAEDIIRMLRAAGINEWRYPIVADIKKKYIGEDTNVLTKESEGEG